LTPDEGINGIRWLPREGAPKDWITLFGRVFENAVFDAAEVAFNSFHGSESVLREIKRIGFYDRIQDHLHQTVCIEMDMDCFLVEWHLSFPTKEERVAWLLISEHEKNLQGWY
jgi:hypothetical protein